MKFKRGLEKDLPILSVGEPGYTTDTHKFFIGSSSGNIQIAKIDDLSDMQSAPVIPNSYGWVSTDGQDTFQIPTGKFYDARLMSVTVGGVPQPNITLIDNKTFQLPEILSSGVNVYVEWYEVAIPVTAGHHSTHEAGGADEIDITKLKNFDQIASVLQNTSSSITPNSYSWVSTDGQDTFQIPNGKFSDVRLMDVTVGGVIQTSITLINDTTFQLPETLSAGMEVYVEWFETSPSATIGHHTTHELNGNDEIDLTKLKNYSRITDFAINVKDYGADSTGTTDSTTAFQNALNNNGKVIIPSGTYLVGALTVPSYTQIIGIGKVTLKHNLNTGYVASGWNRAMIASANQPTYADPSSTNRPNAQGIATNISIENIILDGNGNNVQGIQLTAVDYFQAKNITIQNLTAAATYFVGLRYSKIVDCIAQNCSGDCFAMTDKHFGGQRSFSTDVVFENCLVQNCGSTPSVSDPIPSMFELSDGMNNITFSNCRAINNNGCGFDFHIHTSDWDMTNIHLINCRAVNNTMSTTIDAGVSGFVIGQCPSGSTFRNINYIDCVSIGSQTAFANKSGAETGYKEDISIIGGHWENAFTDEKATRNTNAVIYLGKQFRRFKISNANLYGAVNSYGFYSYTTADGLKISNVTCNGSYIPLGLTHTGGRAEIANFSFNTSIPTATTLSTVCLVLECTDIAVNGVIGTLDVNQYASSIFRFITTSKNTITGVNLENTGTLGSNGIQLDTVGMATLTGNNIKNFTNAIYLSNTSTSIVSVGNNFKGCTNKYNTTPTYLVDAGNAI